MGRPKMDDNEHVTAIARFMLDGAFDSRTSTPWLDKHIVGVDYFTARERVINQMAKTSSRHAIRCRLDDKFRGIAGTTDKSSIPPDQLRLMAVDARLPGMVTRHPDLAVAIDLDRLTLWRRRYPESLDGWLRVQLDLYG